MATRRHAVQTRSAPSVTSWQGPSLRRECRGAAPPSPLLPPLGASLSRGGERRKAWLRLYNLFGQFGAKVIRGFYRASVDEGPRSLRILFIIAEPSTLCACLIWNFNLPVVKCIVCEVERDFH
jgi:hypothetical protein